MHEINCNLEDVFSIRKEIGLEETNFYTNFENQVQSLTVEEINWFNSIVDIFTNLDKCKNLKVNIIHSDHEQYNSKKEQEALGLFYTNKPNIIETLNFISIDNFFIHECYETIFNNKYNLSGSTLEKTLAHEFAHCYQFRHCKRHNKITQEILEEYNNYIKNSS